MESNLELGCYKNMMIEWNIIGNYLMEFDKKYGSNEGNDDSLPDDRDKMPSQLGPFVLNNRQRVMNTLIKEADGLCFSKSDYLDRDFLYEIEKTIVCLGEKEVSCG